MSRKIQIRLKFNEDLEQNLKSQYQFKTFRILSKSLDARGAPRGVVPSFLYEIELIDDLASTDTKKNFPNLGPIKNPPIIVGAGPCGLFAALRLSEYGIPSIILERGAPAEKRMLEISKYWKHGVLNTDTNVCFGEGGAGLFSDGKLITRIKSPFIQYVMDKLVELGAPPETAYLSDPHLGSNKIRQIISKISKYLTSKKTVFRYHSKVDEVLFEQNKVVGVKLASGEKLYSDHVILAFGHSAHEMYHHLVAKNVKMKSKDFAVGVRMEHKRSHIDKIQYGKFVDSKELGAARYRLSHHDQKLDRGAYTFCMCPGGYVLSSGTNPNGIVVNGMSNFARNSPWSNSALVVTIKAGEDFGSGILDGLNYQLSIEEKAFLLSQNLANGRAVPALRMQDFLNAKLSPEKLPHHSCPSGIIKAPIYELFENKVGNLIREAIEKFNLKLPGILQKEALLLAPETRTSAPVTILRNTDSLESLSHSGLYPGGEGAGYAGGITSAAVDGVKIAEVIVRKAKGHLGVN